MPKDERILLKKYKKGNITYCLMRCVICKEEFENEWKRYNQNRGYVCSPKCKGKWQTIKTTGQKRESLRGKSTWNKDKRGIYSSEALKKMRDAKKDIPLSKEHKKKIGKAQEGEKHPNWIDGRSHLRYPREWTVGLRKMIKHRDKYTCQECGRTQKEELEELNRKLPIHHIDYDKMNCSEKNLILLCLRCNNKVNTNRKKWTKKFRKKIIQIYAKIAQN